MKCCAEENVKNFENWFFETFVAEKFLRVLAGKSALKVLFRCLSLGFANLCKGMVLGPSEEGVGNKIRQQIRFLQSSTPSLEVLSEGQKFRGFFERIEKKIMAQCSTYLEQRLSFVNVVNDSDRTSMGLQRIFVTSAE